MCTSGTIAQIFFDVRMLHIKRLVGTFKQRTNVPYPYHYKKGVPYQRSVPVPLQKSVPYQRTVPCCHPCLEQAMRTSCLPAEVQPAAFKLPVIV